jgi:hypothetical protein
MIYSANDFDDTSNARRILLGSILQQALVHIRALSESATDGGVQGDNPI